MKSLVEKHFWLLLGLIVAFAFITRIYQVGQIKAYIFDEVYHAVTAKLIRQNDPRAFEWWNPPPEPNTAVDWLHPPFAKYTQALGMQIFGETPFGWRISAVVFGTLAIAMIALLAEELFHDKRVSILAALLASFDGLLLVQSRIAMNDIHVTFFILLSCFFYLKYRTARTNSTTVQVAKTKTPEPEFTLFHNTRNNHLFLFFLTGLSLGFACASKWSGFFAVGLILFFEGISLLQQIKAYLNYYFDQKFLATRSPIISQASLINGVFQSAHTPSAPMAIVRTIFRQSTKIIVYLLLIPAFIYVLSYSQMFIQGKSLVCEQDFIQQGSCYCEQTNSWWVEGLKTVMPKNTAYWESLEARGGCKRLISHFFELHKQIWWYQTNLKATHPYQSRPMDWFLDLRPVWMFVDYKPDMVANVYAEGNPFLFWLGDIAVFVTIAAILTKSFKEVSSSTASSNEPAIRQNKVVTTLNYIPSLSSMKFLIVAYLIVWSPWQLSPRIMFFYHYTPAVPFLSIILSYGLVKMQNFQGCITIGNQQIEVRRVLLFSAVLAIGFTFFVFYPNWTGIPVPSWLGSVYFLLPSWK